MCQVISVICYFVDIFKFRPLLTICKLHVPEEETEAWKPHTV